MMTTQQSDNVAARAVLSGFSAGVAMLAVFLGAFGALRLLTDGQPSDSTFATWAYNLVHNRLLDLAGSSLYIAFAAHTFVALGFSLGYAFLLEPRLRGRGPWRGVVAALIPWSLSVFAFLPLMGCGVLGRELGAGPLPAIGNLALHAVFGVVLGALYETSASLALDEVSPMLTGAVKGLAFGALVASLVSPYVPATPIFPTYWASLLVILLGLLLGTLTTTLPNAQATPR